MDPGNCISEPNAQTKKGLSIIGSASEVPSLTNREIPQRLMDGYARNRRANVISYMILKNISD